MNKKRIIYIFLGIVLLLVIIGVIYYSPFIQPKILFTAEITPINKTYYNNSDKFKHIRVEIKVVDPLGVIRHVKVARDEFRQYLEGNDKIEIKSGGGSNFEYGNEYVENVLVYLDDLSEDELVNILGDFKYKVTWEDLVGNEESKILYFKDYLK